MGRQCSEGTDATKTGLMLAFRMFCANSSINSLGQAANSFFELKLNVTNSFNNGAFHVSLFLKFV